MDFYEKHGFKLFPCKLDKSPNISAPGIGWRDSEAHLTRKEAEELAERGHLIGAWIPENMVVIDIDRNHTDKLGNPKEDGLLSFKELCSANDLHDLSKSTTVVRTGSGGFHLYYMAPEVFTQRQLTTSVDTRTHNGYVIAAGSPGYSFQCTEPPQEIPEAFQAILRDKSKKVVDRINVKKPLSPDLLGRLLKKIEASHFSSNELWLEFTMSIIATCGNGPEVVQEVVKWSQTDPNYQDDQTIRNRIESFDPDGAITAATFLYILKKEGISPYYIQQVRKQIGAEFTLKTEKFITHYDLPIKLNIEQLEDRVELAKAFFYNRDQAATTRLIEYLVLDKLIYSRGEKQFYYFNGSRWVQWSDILTLIYNILVVTADECFVRFGKDDADAIDILDEGLQIIGSVSWRQKIELALCQSEMISRRSYPWDSPITKESLTFVDGVIDFSTGSMEVRKGRPEEYRRSYIDIPTQEILEAAKPQHFLKVLENTFPNVETRRTATEALSLSVSGTGKYRKFQIWNGAGKNGKSFLMDVMQKVIGDRAITYNTNILLQKARGTDDSGQVTPGIAKFEGALFACGSETEESKKISQGLVKNITGNENITARALYRDEVTFKTTFQMVLATNYLPSFSAYDEAFIDRLLVIPFHTSFYSTEEQKAEFKQRKRKYILPAQDPDKLMGQIMTERPAVLKFLMETYMMLTGEVYESPECKELLALYIEDNNDLGKFLEAYTVLEEKGFTSTKYLVDFFNEEHNTRYSTQWMGKRLKQLHPELVVGRKRMDGAIQRGFYGITLNKEGLDEDF